MIETNIQSLSVEEIMQKIKEEVDKRKQKVDLHKNHLSIAKEKVVLDKTYSNYIKEVNNTIIQKDVYEYSDFTRYHDMDFIKNIYRGILKREADSEGLKYYLALLRSGEKSKSEIISIVRYSKEGKEKKVKLLGCKKRFIVASLYSMPVIGYFVKWLIVFLTLPRLLTRLNSYENYIAQEAIKSYHHDKLLERAINLKADKTELEQVANELQASIETKAEQEETELLRESLQSKTDKEETAQLEQELTNTLNAKADKTELELYLQTVGYAKEYMKISQRNMQNLIDEAKKRLPNKMFDQKEILQITEEEKHKFDSFYVAFEDKFRGSRKEIKERVKVYLPYLEKLPFEKDEVQALDVGCGRGEWLELLQENNYKAQGIDLNAQMVAKSNELGLDVKEMDVIEYLSSLEDNSLHVITGFHIIEHLPFKILMKMYEEAYRVLKSGGMVIFETPNPENVFVGTSNFYTDPTHLNPIPPVTSKFILTQLDYKNVTIKRVSNVNIHYDDPNINHLFASSTDYAVIGYKI